MLTDEHIRRLTRDELIALARAYAAISGMETDRCPYGQ